MITWSKGSAIKQHIKLCDADGKGVDCPTVNCRKCRYDNDIPMLISYGTNFTEHPGKPYSIQDCTDFFVKAFHEYINAGG